MEASLGQIVYSLIPGKGYTTESRASSIDCHEEEFKGLTNSFTTPCHPRIFEEDGFEARMVTCTDKLVFLTRFLYCGNRFNIDEKHRGGLVWHIGVFPRELLAQGLRLQTVEKTMTSFLQIKLDKYEVPMGQLDKIPLLWEETTGPDPDLEGMAECVPLDIVLRVERSFGEKYAKAFVRFGDGKTLDRNGWRKRIGLAFNFAKLLMNAGITRPFSVLSEALHQGSLLFYPNIVIISARDEYYTNDPSWTYAVIPKTIRADGSSTSLSKALRDAGY